MQEQQNTAKLWSIRPNRHSRLAGIYTNHVVDPRPGEDDGLSPVPFLDFMLVSFILGTHPALSLAELRSVLGEGVKFVSIGREVAVVDMEHETWNMEQLQKRLGGTIKIGEVVEVAIQNSVNTEHGTESRIPNPESITQLIVDVLGTARTRAYFGISVYEAGGSVGEVQNMRRQMKSAGPEIKRALQEHYERVRWAVSKEPVLSSVAVVKNKLLPPEGVEVQLLAVSCQLKAITWYIGHTVSVQPFEEYGARDFGRPSRDDRSGMIPPKLAQIMVNLACPASGGAQVKSGGTILDPFCGSGTILQEALLLGHNVLGSDASTKAVTYAKRNLEWLASSVIPAQAGIHVKELDPGSGAGMTRGWRVEEHNVLTLSQWIKPGQVEAIVTEPYLGPQHASSFSVNQARQVNQVVEELSALYLKAFEQFAKILIKGQKVVMIWPVFHGQVFLPIDGQVRKLGFILLTKRGELVYGRVEQRVQREVLVWQRT